MTKTKFLPAAALLAGMTFAGVAKADEGLAWSAPGSITITGGVVSPAAPLCRKDEIMVFVAGSFPPFVGTDHAGKTPMCVPSSALRNPDWN